MQRKLYPKKLNIHCMRNGNRLFLRIIEVQRLDGYPEPAHPMKSHFEPINTFGGFFYQSLQLLNSLTDAEANLLFAQLRNYYRCEVIQEITHPFNIYICNNLIINIPIEKIPLLQAIVALDNAIEELSYQAKCHESEVEIHYCDHLPDKSENNEIIRHTMQNAPNKKLKTELPLSRYLVNWMTQEISNSEEELKDYLNILPCLNKQLDSPNQSLTYAARIELYPDPTFERFIERHCQSPVMPFMLNPDVSHKEATVLLMNHLRFLLASEPLEKEHISKQTREKISTFIHNFELLRHAFWQQEIKKLYGRQALNGWYHTEYTEIKLLLEATITRDQNGLMVLNIKNTRAYEKFYKLPQNHMQLRDPDLQRRHDNLEHELRHACRQLGLEFIPGLNFHKDTLFFDGTSSQFLMNWGFHYNEDYCKSLTRAYNCFRLFKTCNKPILSTAIPRDVETHILAKAFDTNVSDLKYLIERRSLK